MSRAGAPPDVAGVPLVIYLNHASWWDPLICLILQNTFLAERRAYAPMAAEALQKYRFLGRIGFFGVDQKHRRGAAQFLRAAKTVLAQPDTVLWLTPQGRFVDVRERPVRFKSGLGGLPCRIKRAAFVPLALEYAFWEERKPEVFCRFGPIEFAGSESGIGEDATDWTSRFEQRLQATQDALAAEIQRRQPDNFKIILRSGSGVGVVYDTWRRLRAALERKPFKREHGTL